MRTLRYLLASVFSIIISLSQAQSHTIGEFVTAPDGTPGVVFYVAPDGSTYWLVALNDLPGTYRWGPHGDLPELENFDVATDDIWYDLHYDHCGYDATKAMYLNQGHNANYAASSVNLEGGWHIPTTGQLSKLYAALPYVNDVFTQHGGTRMAYDYYWASTECDEGYAWTVNFDDASYYGGLMKEYDKLTQHHVRPVWSLPCSEEPIGGDLPDNIIETDCNQIMPTAFVEPELLHFTDANVNVYSQTLCGDIDGDGIVDIAVAHYNDLGETYRYRSNQIDIYSGNDLSLESTISIPQLIYLQYCTFALAKYPIENGNYQGCVVALCFDGKLRTYTKDGQLLNTSDYDVPCEGTPSIADFNNDGYPEVYIGNAIFDLATLNRLCIGPTNGNMGISYRGTNIDASPGFRSLYAMPFACNLFGDSNLELICGNTIYDVNIVSRTNPSLNSVSVNKTINPPSGYPNDGHVAIADLDLDGKMEVLVTKDPTHDAVTDNCYFYAYSPYTETILFHKAINCRSAAFPTIGNIDDNPNPEILFIDYQQNYYTKQMYCWRYSSENGFEKLWTAPHYDNSGMTSLALFDFNNDEIMEIIHRDQNEIRILDCSNGYVQLYSHIAVSTTFSEHVIVADVNNDGAAEIITTGLLYPTEMNAYGCLLMFGHPEWPDARPVWNQYAYNVTNVNEDLTIPTHCFDNATVFTAPDGTRRRPYNNFLQQATYLDQYGEPYSPTGEVETELWGEGCGSFTYHGTTYTENGVYEQHIQNPNGCDTLVSIHVNLTESIHHAFTASGCDSYTWNGSTYYESGTYTQTFVTPNGCDSIVELQLTIKPAPYVSEIEGQQFIYVADHGTYTYSIQPVAGAHDYVWFIDNNWTISNPVGSPSCSVNVLTVGSATLTVRVYAECGYVERTLRIEHALQPDIVVYPNPTYGDFKLYLYGMDGETLIEIYDAIGQRIAQLTADANVSGTLVEYTLKYHACGLYLISATNRHRNVVKKVVKNTR